MSLTLKLHVGELMTSDGYLSELFVAEVEMYMSDFIDFLMCFFALDHLIVWALGLLICYVMSKLVLLVVTCL